MSIKLIDYEKNLETTLNSGSGTRRVKDIRDRPPIPIANAYNVTMKVERRGARGLQGVRAP